jgi:hypothetical protein
MKEEIYTGYWWLGGDSKNYIQGTLRIKDNKVGRLDIIGKSDDIQRAFPSLHPNADILNISNLEIINGYAKGGDEEKDTSFCLVNCLALRHVYSGLDLFEIQPTYILKTILFKTLKEIRFQEVFLKFDHLDDWVSKHGFEINDSRFSKKFVSNVTYSQPDPIILLNNSKYKIYLFFRAYAPIYGAKNSVTISQSVFFNLQFKRRQKLSVVAKHIMQIQDFFSFMVSVPVGKKKIEFRKFTHRSSTKNKSANNTGELLYPDNVKSTEEKMSSKEMLLNFDIVSKNSANIMELWFQKYNELEPVMRFYFDTYYSRYLSPRTRFLNLLFALEIYYKSKIGGRQVAFKSALTQLYKDFYFIVKFLYPTKKSFIEKLLNTRKYFVHDNTEVKKTSIIKEEELFNQSDYLRALLQSIILKELNFENDLIIDRVKIANYFSVAPNFQRIK